MIRFLTAFLLALSVFSAAPQASESKGNICFSLTDKYERKSAIPPHLLSALASVESGHYSAAHKANVAWPWTVMAEGKGQFFPTKQAAVKAVKAMQARGVKSIDVGCMQINLKWHGDAFDSLEEAFDPAKNVAYAASFLKSLKRELGSWVQAAGAYHSREPHKNRPYRARVVTAWETIRLAEKNGSSLLKSGVKPMELAGISTASAQAEPEKNASEKAGEAAAWRKARIAAYMKKRASWKKKRQAG